MASEEERTETTSEAPREDTHEVHMIVSLSIFKSQEQAPAAITLVIILSQRFDIISNKYFDKNFCGLERHGLKTLNAMWPNVASNQRNIFDKEWCS